MYTDAVMDHFFNPRNAGELRMRTVGEAGNPVCGDIMRIYLKIKDDIEEVKFKTFGCGATIATSSMLTEMVKGKTVAEAEKITNRAVAEALGGLPQKMHCSNPADAFHKALANYRQNQAKLTPAASATPATPAIPAAG